MYAPEVLDFLDGGIDKLMHVALHEGFPQPYDIPGERVRTLGWYRYEVEAWFADRVIRELQGSTADAAPSSEVPEPDYTELRHLLSTHTWAAKFPGTCATCQERFEAGTYIGKIDGRYVEWLCIAVIEEAEFLDTPVECLNRRVPPNLTA